MTEDHWKQSLLLALLPFLLLSGTLLKECHGQAGTNYFYYYSPTQRTMVNHGLTSGTGQIFGSPYFNQHQQQPQTQQQQQFEQPANQQQQQTQPNFPFPTVPPSFQQSTLLGYNNPQFHRQQQHQRPFQNVFPPSPPAQLQYPLVTPTPDPQQQELYEQQTQPAFNTFSRFGNNAHLLGRLPQTSQPSFFSTQSPLGTVAPGAYNFFQSPFQFLQQRFMQDAAQPTSVPEMHDLPTPTTTLPPSPPPQPPSPTPTTSDVMNVPAVEQAVPKRPRISSRFRYVQQPPQPQIRQYNPYSQLGSPYTSDLPYTEQRFYSSPTTPTGYAFSLGGDNAGNGATSTVHFSMGPRSKIQQHLTEITATRQMLQRQQIEQSTPDIPEIVPSAPPTEKIKSQDAPAEPIMSTTSTPAPTPAPVPQTPEPMSTVEVVSDESTNSTLEPLLNEPSLQTETIAAPAAAISPEVTRKISETNIPKRLVIRKKVARNRLRLNGNSGEIVDSQTPALPIGVMIRRRIASPNRLPVEEPKQFEEEAPKGPVVSSVHEAPVVTTPSTTTTTTTTTEPSLPEQMVAEHDVNEEEIPQEHNMEPQPASSAGAPSSEEAPIMPLEETQMTENEMAESQENNKNNDASDNLRQDPPSSRMSSMTPEETPAAMRKDVEEMRQPIPEQPSSTPTPIQMPPLEIMMPEDRAPLMADNKPEQPIKHEDEEEYYYEDEPPQPHSMPKEEAPSQVMTAVMAPESSDELPILDGVQKNDFPAVFHPDSSPFDNSVETDQGEVIIRITSSHPSSEQESVEMVAPPAIPSPPSMMLTSSTTTTEETPPEFSRDDPAEEQPPMDSEEPVAPVFQPTTTTTTTTTTEVTPMMTTTPNSSMSSTANPSTENSEMGSAEENDEESHADSLPAQENHDEASSNEMSSSSSTTEIPEEPMPPMDDMPVSSTESVAEAPEMMIESMNVSSTTEAAISGGTQNDFPEISEMASPSSTDSTQTDEEISARSSTTMAPPSATTEATSSEEHFMTMDVSVSKSQEVQDSIEIPFSSQEMPTDSEEIGKAQRLALEETLRRLREKQQTTSTSQPQDQSEDSPDNEVPTGRRVFSRKPIVVTNLPLPTSRPISNVNAVLDEEDGVDRSKVLQKIIRFRTTTTTTKRPRRVTRPSLSTERHLAVVEPVEDLLEDQEQVDSFSDSSSTPGTTAQPATTTPSTPKYSRSRMRTTPSTSTTTAMPEESSTTPPTTPDDEMTYPIHTTTSTETYTTTPLPPMFTPFTDESSSTTESIMAMVEEMSSTTEIEFEHVTAKGERDMTGTTFSSTTTEAPMMTTTTPAPIEAMTTTPSTTTYSTMTDFSSDEKDDFSKNDDDVFYEENPASVQDAQVISSTEVSTEEPQKNPSSTTTTTPPSTTDSIYTYLTTVEPISGSATTTTYENDQSSTTIDPEVSSSTTISPDLSSSPMTATTPTGQLIIHEILPTMPPLHEVSFVIGESVEDDQSSAIDTSSANESDELLAADKAVVRVEAKVHISTNATDIRGASGEQSQESQELTQPRMFNSAESGESGQRRVVKKVVKIKKSRRLRRPGGESESGDNRRRRRKVLYRRPQ